MQDALDMLVGQAPQQNTPGVPLNSTASSPNPSAPGGGDALDALVAQPPPGSQQSGTSGFSNAHGDGNLDTNTPNDNVLTHIGKGVAAVGAGVGKGVLDTLSGTAGLVGADSLKQRFDEGRAELDKDNAANPTLNNIGYGSETLAEFMLGDEALKGLSFADKLAAVSKTAKVLESSPRLINALKIGARTAARQGTIQAVQTGLRTDGSLADRAKAGLVTGTETGVVGGVLGGVGNLLEDTLSSAAKAAKGVPKLQNIAATAKSSPDVIQALSERIGASEDALHQTYENGINDLKTRLAGTEVDPTDNPMQAKAKELLVEPIPADHPAVAQAVKTANAGMDAKTKTLLETLANGNDPAAEAARDEELAEKAKEAAANKPSGLVDAQGKPLGSPKPLDVEPEPIPARPYNIDDLIKLRQTIRQAANNYEPSDLNARTLRSLLWDAKANGGKGGSAIDDTIAKLAEQSDDPSAVADYKNLRSNYRDHINDFQDPLIQKIRDGKLDDAASQYVGIKRTGSNLPPASKVVYNTDVLRNILGDDGLHQFGKEVFNTMLSNATTDGNVDYIKFINLWNKVNDQSKGSDGIFNLGDAKNGLAQLAKDAQAAATLQRVAKLGLGAAGGVAAGYTGAVIPNALAIILGLTVADGRGVVAGRQMLDSMANSPHLWQAALRAGKIAPAIPMAATAATGLAGQAINSVNGNNDPNLQRRVYQDGASGLQ